MAKSSSFMCASCGKNYTRKSSLKRHIDSNTVYCFDKKKSFECRLCSKKYYGKQTLKNHVKSVHSRSFECASCSKIFCCRSKLVRHIRSVHNYNAREQLSYECYHCARIFHRREGLVEHIYSCRNNPDSNKSISNVNRFKCGVCDRVFQSKKCINEHYRTAHDILLNIRILTLKSFDEFSEWKYEIQRQSVTQFVKQRSSESKTHSRKEFVCHRSSINRAHSRKKTDKIPKRNGLKKLQTFCPAEMDVRISKADGTCIVNYTETHIGHSVNDLTEGERSRIAACLKDVVPKSETRKRKLSSENDKTGSRLSDIRSTNIENVETDYVIDERTHENDYTDVDIFVKNNEESVLFYKNQSMEDTKFDVLKENDFILVYMNKTQEKYLRRYAKNVICFDGMQVTNDNCFQLHTLLVLNVDRVGYPAAFIVTNRYDQIAIDIFLKCIKERVGNIETRVIMTDMQRTYYDSWISIMDTVPEFHLYCSWHVNNAWQKKFPKRLKSPIAQEIKEQLHNLHHELNPFLFEEKLTKFLAIDEDDFKDFIDYFRHNYAEKPHLWAYCHRLHAGINVNASLKSFHKKIKCRLANNANVNWLSRTLTFLKEYLELRNVEDEIKYIRGVDGSKFRDLRRAHDDARRFCENRNVDEFLVVVDDNTFFVQSSSENDISYIVTKKHGPKECTLYDDVICGLECHLCDICFHEYICNCIENSIRSCMCQHIHMVGLYKKKHR